MQVFSDALRFLSTTGRKTQTINKLRGKGQGQDVPVWNSSPFLHSSENFHLTLDQPHLILWGTLTFLPIVLLSVQPMSHSQWHTNYAVFPSQFIVCSMSPWWVTGLCVLPQRQLCYLLIQWPRCYTGLSCVTALWLFFHDFPASFMQ